MNISKALKIVVGNTVACPADRGDPAYMGRVTYVGTTVLENIHGDRYIYVEVQTPWGNRKTMWPSNRLG